MKALSGIIILLLLLNCSNERVVQLPEIETSEITEVRDVSAAYLFYDESYPDSTLLNRKNLISTTNWLINVDRRLSLKQVIPHIQFLQHKKSSGKLHKNEKARNYYTCNDSSINNLGFIDFTTTTYEDYNPNFIGLGNLNAPPYLKLTIHKDGSVGLAEIENDFIKQSWEPITVVNQDAFKLLLKESNLKFLLLTFDEQALFQTYVRYKSYTEALKNEGYLVAKTEYLF